jgi:hypothetical protein
VNYIGKAIDTGNTKERHIMRFTIAAAAVAALLAAVPASAHNIGGGPIKQNGQCWKAAKLHDGGSFGTWGACPQAASTATTRRR